MVSRKKIKKLIDGACCVCGITDQALLDTHRIIPGGKYCKNNEITVCANCHRKIHDKQIQILGKNFCSNGRMVIHCIIDGEELFV